MPYKFIGCNAKKAEEELNKLDATGHDIKAIQVIRGDGANEFNVFITGYHVDQDKALADTYGPDFRKVIETPMPEPEAGTVDEARYGKAKLATEEDMAGDGTDPTD